MAPVITYEVQTPRATAEWFEEEMRHAVAFGTLSGTELVRLRGLGEEAWMPLYTLPWFAALADVKPGEDLEAAARRRARIPRGLRIAARAVGGYFGCAALLGAIGGFHKPGGPLAVGLIGGTLAFWAASIVGKREAAKKRYDADRLARKAPVPVRAAALPERDELIEAIARLERDLQRPSAAMAASLANPAILRRCAAHLREQRALLEGLLRGEAREQRQAALAAARERLAAAGTNTLKDAINAEIAALEAHEASALAAETSLRENRVRHRALLHQVEALRLTLGKKALGGDARAAMDRLAEMQGAIVEEEKIEDEIRRAVRPPQVLAGGRK